MKPYTKTKTGNLKITLTNDFHNTSVTVVAKPSSCPRQYFLTASQVRRAEKALCGISDCACANGQAGTRNQQFVELTACEDGGVDIYVTPIQ